MRPLIAIAVLSLPTLVVAAPAPVYRSQVSPELEAVFQAGENHRRAADRIRNRLHQEHPLTSKEKAHLRDQCNAALRSAAEQYIRFLEVANSIAKLQSEMRDRYDRAAMGAVKTLWEIGEPARAVRLYDRLAHRPTEPKARVSLMASILSFRMELKQAEECRKLLQSIGKEVPKMDEPDRDAWERWLRDATATMKK